MDWGWATRRRSKLFHSRALGGCVNHQWCVGFQIAASWDADHQMLNARYFADGGGAIVVDQADLHRVPALAQELLADPARLARMRDAMLALAKPDAADVIADELVSFAGAAR